MRERVERRLTVVTVGGETDDDHGSSEREDPDGRLGLGCEGSGGLPDGVDGRVWADGVGDVIGSVGERGSAGGHDLEERVQVLGLVRVLLDG